MFEGAAYECSRRGAQLAFIDSEEEDAFIRSLLPANMTLKPWIGLKVKRELRAHNLIPHFHNLQGNLQKPNLILPILAIVGLRLHLETRVTETMT